MLLEKFLLRLQVACCPSASRRNGANRAAAAACHTVPCWPSAPAAAAAIAVWLLRHFSWLVGCWWFCCCCCKGDRCRGSSRGEIGPGAPVFLRAVFMHRWTCSAACFALRPPRNALDTSSASSCRTLAKSCCSRACPGCLVARDLTLRAGCSSALLCRLKVMSAAEAKFSLTSWAVLVAQAMTSRALTSKAFCCSDGTERPVPRLWRIWTLT
jgi:hypothetical protein